MTTLGDDWELDEDGAFVGMPVTVDVGEDDAADGEIAAVWLYQGEPERLDIDRGDDAPLLNVAKGADRLEVGR